jgi:hypothetical protein
MLLYRHRVDQIATAPDGNVEVVELSYKAMDPDTNGTRRCPARSRLATASTASP